MFSLLKLGLIKHTYFICIFQGNNITVVIDQKKGYIDSSCCSPNTKTYNILKRDEPEELLDEQNEGDSLEKQNITPKTKNKNKQPKKKTRPDTE